MEPCVLRVTSGGDGAVEGEVVSAAEKVGRCLEAELEEVCRSTSSSSVWAPKSLNLFQGLILSAEQGLVEPEAPGRARGACRGWAVGSSARLKGFTERVPVLHPRASVSAEPPSTFLTLLLRHQNLPAGFSLTSLGVVSLFFRRGFHPVC